MFWQADWHFRDTAKSKQKVGVCSFKFNPNRKTELLRAESEILPRAGSPYFAQSQRLGRRVIIIALFLQIGQLIWPGCTGLCANFSIISLYPLSPSPLPLTPLSLSVPLSLPSHSISYPPPPSPPLSLN